MLSFGIIKFFFYLALPYLITRGLAWLSQRNGTNKGKPHAASWSKPMSPRETFIFSLVLVALLNGILRTYGPSRSMNFFEIIDCPVNSPTFLVREHYQAYCQRRAEESQAFKNAMNAYEEAGSPSLLDDENNGMTGAYRRHRAAARAPFLPYIRYTVALLRGHWDSSLEMDEDFVSEEQLEFEYVTFMFERLKMPSKRTIYLRFGEEAFIDGTYCREDTDFMMFIAPSVLFTYFQFLLVVGFLTSLSRKSKWRSVAILFVCILLFCETLYYISPQEMESLQLFEYLFPASMHERVTQYQKLDLCRRLLFSAALLLMLLIDHGHKVSDLDLLQHIQGKQDANLARDQTLKLMRQAIFMHPTLRQFYLDQADKAEALYRNDEFNKETARLLEQYDLDKFAQMVDDDMKQVFDSMPSYAAKAANLPNPAQTTPASTSTNSEKSNSKKNHKE